MLVGITLFAAAYMAEVIHRGLQAMPPKGKTEAAAPRSGLTYLADAVQDHPAAGARDGGAGIMNNFISICSKDDLARIHRVDVRTADRRTGHSLQLRCRLAPVRLEGYLFIALIFRLLLFAMSEPLQPVGGEAGQQKQTALTGTTVINPGTRPTSSLRQGQQMGTANNFHVLRDITCR